MVTMSQNSLSNLSVTLVGHGYVGTALFNRLSPRHWISHSCDIPCDSDIVINACGYVGEQSLLNTEIRRQHCIHVNALYPYQLSLVSKIPVIHVSSGCIYNGFPDQGFRETDDPNFGFDQFSTYGGSKILMETLLLPFLERDYVLRLRLPFSRFPSVRNLLTKFRTYPTVLDTANSISNLEDFADFISFIINERPLPGIYNVVNPGYIHYRDLLTLMGIRGKSFLAPSSINLIDSVPRPSCFLNTDKLQSIFSLEPVHDRVRRCLDEACE
jgi:dTDP-4-dehydrorhamnose reductase